MSSLAIAQIAGRDSVAAVVEAVRLRGFSQILPTIALTGTETGDFDAPRRAIVTLADRLGDGVEVLEPVELSDPALWSALNARFATTIQRSFGLYSPCLACHLYLHLLRVPVSWAYYNAPVIAGERDTHDGRIKLSQTRAGIDTAISVLDHAGVELIEPVRSLSGDQIAQLAGDGWDEGAGQMGCVLSGNYRDLDSGVRFDADAYARYVSEFFEPVGRAVIDAWRDSRTSGEQAPPIDYEAIARAALERL